MGTLTLSQSTFIGAVGIALLGVAKVFLQTMVMALAHALGKSTAFVNNSLASLT